MAFLTHQMGMIAVNISTYNPILVVVMSRFIKDNRLAGKSVLFGTCLARKWLYFIHNISNDIYQQQDVIPWLPSYLHLESYTDKLSLCFDILFHSNSCCNLTILKHAGIVLILHEYEVKYNH